MPPRLTITVAGVTGLMAWQVAETLFTRGLGDPEETGIGCYGGSGSVGP